MARRLLVSLGLGLILALAGAVREVAADAAIRIAPPDGSRFAVDQLFDLRVELRPTPGARLTEAALSLDGEALPVSPAGLDPTGGFTLRRRSYGAPGRHELRATARDSFGAPAVTAVSRFEVVAVAGPRNRFRNVIILLGDGMGAAHRTAARIVRHGYAGGRALGLLAMDQLPVTGMVMTSSLNSIVTDSSPGMSSYVTGNKANNNEEGVFPDNTGQSGAADASTAFDNPRVEYLGEYLHRKLGKVLGLVTTADVEDATPAANAVHTANRNAGTGICDQYLDERELPEGRGNGLAVLMGGGKRWFLPATNPLSSRAARTDYRLDAATAQALGVPPGAIDPERDLLADFQRQGFRLVETDAALAAAAADPATERLLGLFANGNMNAAYDKIAKRRRPDQPAVVDDYQAPHQPLLAEMAAAALTVLSRSPRGFVLMVEGAHIDKQAHAMDATRTIWEVLEFDDAVRTCRDFAARRGDTLVIVAADHETAGFSLLGSANELTVQLRHLPSDAGNLAPHTDPAEEPEREKAVGTYEQAGFPHYSISPDGYPEEADPDGKLLVGFGSGADRFESWLTPALPLVDSLLSDTLRKQLQAGADATSRAYPSNAVERDHETGYFVRGQVPGAAAAHTATDIVLSAYAGEGPDARMVAGQFTGYQDNTDVFFKLLRAALGGYGEAVAGGAGAAP